MTGFTARLNRLLISRHIIALAVLAGALLTLPSLRVGWMQDDLFHRLLITRPEAIANHRSSWDLFRFMDGDTTRTQRMMDEGVVPWWTWPQIRAAFWRPLTVATHQLDNLCWPNSAPMMHLHSVLWYAALLAGVGLFYRRLMGLTWVAGLAAVLYAIDDAHGLPVGWLANRNAVIATCFGVWAIICHHQWRCNGSRWAGPAAWVLLAMSLLSAEAGMGTCAYLFAYAVFLDQGSRRARWLSLLPYALLVVVWRLAWSAQGCGADGLGLYADPLHEPGRYLGLLTMRAPLLLLGQWALPPADATFLLGPQAFLAASAAAAVAVLCIGIVIWRVVRCQPLARFWACGMLLAVLPVAATFPSDRLLFFVGLGVAPLIAMFLQTVLRPQRESNDGPRSAVKPGRASVVRRVSGWGLVIIHLVIAPAGLAMRSAYPLGPPRVAAQLSVRTPLDERAAGQDVIIVNPPSTMHAMYLPTERTLAHQPSPRRTRVLAPGRPWVDVYRRDAHTLVIKAADGYLRFILDSLFRDDRHPFRTGDRVDIAGMRAEIISLTADRRPYEVAFTFDVPLEDSSLRWLQYKDGDFVPFSPPSVGQTIRLEGRWPA